MKYLTILQLQLNSLLGQKIINEIATVVETLDLLVLAQEGPMYAIHQPAGKALVIVVLDGPAIGSGSFSIDVPLDIEDAQKMFDLNVSQTEFIEAFGTINQEVIGSFLVSYMYEKGVSLKKQAEYHCDMIREEITDAFLVVFKSGSDIFSIRQLFLGDRIDLGAEA